MGWNVLGNTDILTQSVQKDSRRFKDIAFAVSDSRGYVYIIDQYRTRLVKLDPDGNMVFEINQKDFFESTNSFFNELTVDEDGNIYTVCDILDPGGYYTTKYEIRKYEPDGGLSKVLDTIDYSDVKMASRGNYLDMKVIGNDLCYYITKNNITTRCSVSLKDGSKSSGASFQTGDVYDLFRVTGSQKDFLYYETGDRKIYRTDQYGAKQVIFNGSRGDLSQEISPRKLSVDSDGKLYFLDQIHSKIYKISPEENYKAEVYISLEKYVKSGEFSIAGRYTALTPLAGNKIMVADEDTYMVLNKDGTRIKESSIAGMTAEAMKRTILIWAQAVLCVFLLIAIVLILYFKILNRRMILFFKYALALIPSSIIIIGIIGYYMYGVFSQNFINEKMEKLKVASNSGSVLIDGDFLDRIQTSDQCMEPEFKSKVATVEDILQVDDDGHRITGMYAVIYKKVGNRIYTLYDSDWNTMPFTLYTDNYKTSDMAKLFSDGSNMENKDDRDVNGRYVDCLMPIYNTDNEITGAFEVGVYMYSIENMLKSMLHWFLFVALCGILVLSLLILVVSHAVLIPLKTLRKSVYEMSKGKMDVHVSDNARDEVGDLCKGFNIMTNHIRESIKMSKQTSEAYFRFVPERMLQLLGKESIVHIKTGDTVKRDMSVMWLEIRSFYSVSASLNAEQNYAYLNSLLMQFSPAIRENSGMVEKYLGSDITAVFPDKADDAVMASVRIISVMEDINHKLGKSDDKKLNIGISLYKGDVMLGTIGEEKRMECTMILDDGNILQYMCRLSNKLNVSILASESIIQSLENKNGYLYRYMGKIVLENTAEPIRIYDIFQGDREHIRNLHTYTKESFEKGIRFYENGEFLEARTCFIDVLRRDREDGAAKVYFSLSDESYQRGKKVDWNDIFGS
jgi:class 3 adenylate cyclase